MTADQAIKLMNTSKSMQEWNTNREVVKAAYGGVLPNWWYGFVSTVEADKIIRGFNRKAFQ